MKAVIQRVLKAEVSVDNAIVGKINRGLLVLIGIENGDDKRDAEILASKISGMRIFTDEKDKMNLSLSDIDGGVLVISNFTLCADCSHGRRPSFINAARPEIAKPLYEYFSDRIKENGISCVENGVFGADMQVSLVNDGPVTIVIDSKDLKK